MLCVRCGRVIEFREEDLEELQQRICEKFSFEAIEHRMGIRGICRECQRKDRDEGQGNGSDG